MGMNTMAFGVRDVWRGQGTSDQARRPRGALRTGGPFRPLLRYFSGDFEGCPPVASRLVQSIELVAGPDGQSDDSLVADDLGRHGDG